MGQMAGESHTSSDYYFVITGVGLSLPVLSQFHCLSGGLDTPGLGKYLDRQYIFYLLTISNYRTILRNSVNCDSVPYNSSVVLHFTRIHPIVLDSFSLCFFAVVLVFTLRPSSILDSVGKYINPIFLHLLLSYVLQVNPMAQFRCQHQNM